MVRPASSGPQFRLISLTRWQLAMGALLLAVALIAALPWLKLAAAKPQRQSTPVMATPVMATPVIATPVAWQFAKSSDDDPESTLIQRWEQLNAMSAAQLESEFKKEMDQWRLQFARLGQAHSAFFNSTKEESVRWDVQFRQAKKLGEVARKKAGLIAVVLVGKTSDKEVDPDVAVMAARSMDEFILFEKYRLAYEAGKALLDAKLEEPAILSMFGYAAWSTNHFQEARDAFSKAIAMNYQLPDLYEAIRLDLDQSIATAEAERLKDEAKENLPLARIKTTKGELTVELFEDQAPNAVANFISLAEKGFFDGQEFFDTQASYLTTGSPTNDVTGNAGYQIRSEYEREDRRAHLRGSLTLMVVEITGNGSSQFSILTQPQPNLDHTKNNVFGRVIEGDLILDDIARVGKVWKDLAATGNIPLPEPDQILSVKIIRKRPHEYQPEKTDFGF